MIIKIDFTERCMRVSYPDNTETTVKFSCIAQFLVANLFTTITWMITDNKNKWLEHLQSAIDHAEEIEIENTSKN